MKNGDLSNHGCIKIAFRVEDTLLKKQSDGRVADFMRKFNRLHGYVMDTSVAHIIRRIYTNTDYCVVLVLDGRNADKEEVSIVKKFFPYCEIVEVNHTRISEIEINLLSKEWEYYIDDNDHRRAKIGHPAAVSLKDFLETCMKV